MRRRRKPLEVSTFPFLAVLLCAMGALIFVLLVMDRKAKMGARQKALAAVARASDEAEQEAAARRAELERHMQEKRAERQAEWEKKRDALHTRLLTEQQALQRKMQELRDQMTLAAARLRLEQEQSGELQKQVEAGRGQVQGETTALTAAKQGLADSEKRTEQEKAAMARMTNDLVVLERALKDLKETRERERQTYSVIPYRGKRGESRRPLYVECASDTVLFYPDKKPVPVRNPESVRAEVARRVVRQREQLAAAKMPVDETPYLMLLVRPGGIGSYYAFEAAFAGLDVQFGYELIDADWVLDFPEENQPGTQPWQTLAQRPDLPPLDSSASSPNEAKVRGVQFRKGAWMQPIASGPGGGSDTPGPGTGGIPGVGTGTQSDNPVSPGGLGRPVAQGATPGIGEPATADSPGPSGLPKLPWETSPPGSVVPGAVRPRGYRGSPGGNTPPLQAPREGAATDTATAGNAGVGGGQREGNKQALPDVPPLPGTGTVARGDSPTGPTSNDAKPESGRGVPGSGQATGGTPGSGQATGGTPGEGLPPGSQPRDPSATGQGEPGSGNADAPPPGVFRPLKSPGMEAKRPPALHTARLNGDRDYLIFIECKENSVVLYPAQREFPLTALTGKANDPLVQAVQQMIERKQSGVRPGELAFRPQIRFLVRPETLRAFHEVYPLFNALPATKTRQNLLPEDDVRSIIAGN